MVTKNHPDNVYMTNSKHAVIFKVIMSRMM